MADALLTDDLIEKGARALCQEDTGWAGDEDMTARQWELNSNIYEDQARAVLQAILPDVIEACAKVADDSYDSKNLADRSPRHIAHAIRSLVSQEKE